MYELDCSCFRRDVQDICLRYPGVHEGQMFPVRTKPSTSLPARPCAAPPRPAPTRPWYVRVLDSSSCVQKTELPLCPCAIRNTNTTPGHALYDVSNPKPGPTTGGSGRSARRSGWAGSGRIECQQNCSPRKQKSTVFPKASKKRRFNVFPKARTSETLCKSTEEQNQRLTRC